MSGPSRSVNVPEFPGQHLQISFNSSRNCSACGFGDFNILSKASIRPASGIGFLDWFDDRFAGLVFNSGDQGVTFKEWSRSQKTQPVAFPTNILQSINAMRFLQYLSPMNNGPHRRHVWRDVGLVVG
jgi:hypothetical protein